MCGASSISWCSRASRTRRSYGGWRGLPRTLTLRTFIVCGCKRREDRHASEAFIHLHHKVQQAASPKAPSQVVYMLPFQLQRSARDGEKTREGHLDAGDGGEDEATNKAAAETHAGSLAATEEFLDAIHDVCLALLRLEDRVSRLRRTTRLCELGGTIPCASCWVCARLGTWHHLDGQLEFCLRILLAVEAEVGMDHLIPDVGILEVLLVHQHLLVCVRILTHVSRGHEDKLHVVRRGLPLVPLEAVLEELLEGQDSLRDRLVAGQRVLVPHANPHQVLEVHLRELALPLQAVVEHAVRLHLHPVVRVRHLGLPDAQQLAADVDVAGVGVLWRRVESVPDDDAELHGQRLAEHLDVFHRLLRRLRLVHDVQEEGEFALRDPGKLFLVDQIPHLSRLVLLVSPFLAEPPVFQVDGSCPNLLGGEDHPLRGYARIQ
mmetsp:Transcript_26140/g.85964  ORF Transcript_26140/g.85964 Transcript_26140/m.85964 type:complete len:434 (+) Transcript_26140:1271-2572(+)